MGPVGLGVPRLIWAAAMVIVVAAATAIVATRGGSSESHQEAAAAAVAEAPADDGTGVIDDGGAASTGQPASSVAATEPDGAGTTGTVGERAETTTTATGREHHETTTTGTALQPADLCDTTPPLTAHPSCPGYRTTTLPPEEPIISGTVPPTYGGDECHQAPGRVTTTTAPPYCTSSIIPTVTAAPPVTTDICDPNAVSTTHPSCVGDPYFCGSVTTIPTCPARPPGG